jgi:hypothetical protein
MLAMRLRFATGILVAAVASHTHGAELQYSWIGRLSRFEAASADPWGVGLGGVEFRLQATAFTDAPDQNPTQAAFAVFAAHSLRLWIDGIEATAVDDAATIEFMDTPTLDLAIATGRFALLGVALDFSSVVGLPPTTFSLDLPSRAPPNLASTVTSGRGASGGGPYATVVEAGVPVTVAPEPGAWVLAAGSMWAARLRRRFSYRGASVISRRQSRPRS